MPEKYCPLKRAFELTREWRFHGPLAVTLYGLRDPRTDTVCYVGVTRNVAARLAGHRKHPNVFVGRWLGELKAEGEEPSIIRLGTLPPQSWEYGERETIRRIRHEGFDLHNIHAGGRWENGGAPGGIPGNRGFTGTPKKKGRVRTRAAKRRRAQAKERFRVTGCQPKNQPPIVPIAEARITPGFIRPGVVLGRVSTVHREAKEPPTPKRSTRPSKKPASQSPQPVVNKAARTKVPEHRAWAWLIDPNWR